MNFRQQMFWTRRALLIALGLAATGEALAAGDPIRFSKPAVPIAAPAKEQKLPESRDRLDFSSPDFQPAVAMPRVPQPAPMMRREPRDERDDVPRIFQTPKIFTDPDEEKARKEAAADQMPLTSGRKRPTSPFAREESGQSALGQSRFEQTRGLTPETRFDWDPRDSSGRKKEFGQKETDQRDSRDDRSRGDFTRPGFTSREDDRLSFTPRAVATLDFSGARPKEKLTPAQMQLRADFEQLLNPTAGAAGKSPNSLQPVVSTANAKPGSLAVPTVGSAEIDPRDPRSGDPMANLNRQHERLRGPVLEDINRKYNSPAASTTSGSAADTRNQSLLNREPIGREFPSRKF